MITNLTKKIRIIYFSGLYCQGRKKKKGRGEGGGGGGTGGRVGEGKEHRKISRKFGAKKDIEKFTPADFLGGGGGGKKKKKIFLKKKTKEDKQKKKGRKNP